MSMEKSLKCGYISKKLYYFLKIYNKRGEYLCIIHKRFPKGLKNLQKKKE